MSPQTQELPEATRELRVQPPPRGPVAQKTEDNRGPWYLLTGLILGLIFGLAYAWLVNPVVNKNTDPASLAAPYKNTYRDIIAQTYRETGDLARAASRLALLEDPDPVESLGAQAQQALAEGKSEEAYALALLASALQSGEPAQAEPLPTATLPAVPTRTLPVKTPPP